MLQSHAVTTARTMNILAGGDGSIASTDTASRSAGSPDRTRPLVERGSANGSDGSDVSGSANDERFLR